MPTLEEQRRGVRQSVASSRAATGEAQRNATGQRIVKERRGADVVEDINRLATPAKTRRSLPSVPAVGALPAGQGRGVYKAPENSGGGGIASPLIEKTKVVGAQTVPDAEYWPAGYTSSDGLFVLPAIKTRNFVDANEDAVVFQFANPQGSAP